MPSSTRRASQESHWTWPCGLSCPASGCLVGLLEKSGIAVQDLGLSNTKCLVMPMHASAEQLAPCPSAHALTQHHVRICSCTWSCQHEMWNTPHLHSLTVKTDAGVGGRGGPEDRSHHGEVCRALLPGQPGGIPQRRCSLHPGLCPHHAQHGRPQPPGRQEDLARRLRWHEPVPGTHE